ncbi:MAG: undecaprenyldiphospho-muramoylpentapeptide beta-N-acetylglucosaminyltransferase [Thermodesulfovibrio sp.]|nr:undecaprenyldiphospho-muramoylpentapeptide beta-N-acetylglucosaminyltransferase [Thermodesulfovibrio sp.]
MKIIIAGGGTGGHLFPAIALAEEIKSKYPSSELLFVGTKKGLEAKIIPQMSYKLKFISVQGFVGKSVKQKINSVAKLLKSFFESKQILDEFSPDIVFGVGGYVSFPIVFLAHFRKIPTVILEQNIVPGLANKILGKLVSAVVITYPESIDYFPKYKVFLTGTPIRKSILSADINNARKIFELEENRITVLIFGGSLGARKINKAMIEALPYLIDLKDSIQFIHQTGIQDFSWVSKEYETFSFKAKVLPFIHDMPEAYHVADLVVCRAGASTVAEITALGKASILIPYPYAVYNHQEINARKLLSQHACEMILDRELSGEILAKNIKKIIGNPQLKRNMEIASKAFGKPNASEKILEVVETLVRRRF